VVFVVVFVVVVFLVDFGLVAEEVDLAETGAGAARGDAEVFEDITIRVGIMDEVRAEKSKAM
jgi:hypothetical protein